MNIEIIKIEEHDTGKIFTFSIGDQQRKILYLFHALERMLKWSLTPEIVAETMLLPEEIISGHRRRYIAHKRYGNHLVRAVYEYKEEMPVLVTVYLPYIDRYFRGGGIYEDKIF
jgi:hypothetical protein